MTGSFLAGGPVQIAYAVDDVRAVAQLWADDYGVGPFFVWEHIPADDPTFDHSAAFGWWGGMMVELFCVHSPPELNSATSSRPTKPARRSGTSTRWSRRPPTAGTGPTRSAISSSLLASAVTQRITSAAVSLA